MSRKTIKMLLAAIVASFAIASMAEAAPKKAVRHRVRHSSRVSSGAAATAGNRPTSKNQTTAASKKQTTAASKKQTTAAAKARRRAPAAKGKGALKKSTTGKSTAKPKPLTKPR
jgi:hypothetical protein